MNGKDRDMLPEDRWWLGHDIEFAPADKIAMYGNH
jgi:hypothetical protein